MKIILFAIFLVITVFLLFHFTLFCIETRKKMLNPRSRMYDEGPYFHEVGNNKTKNMYYIEER